MSINIDYNKLHNPQLEKDIIINIINNKQLDFIFENIKTEYLYNDFLKECFKISYGLYQNNETIDYFSVYNNLKSVYKTEKKLNFLVGLINDRINLLDHHIEEIENLYKKRMLVLNCEETLMNIEEENYQDIYFKHFTQLENDFKETQKIKVNSMKDNVLNSIKRREDIMSGKIKLLTMGYRTLANAKIENGDYVVVAARPKMGKTTFILNCIKRWCEDGKRVVFFSLEMNATKLTDRLIQINSNVENIYRMTEKEYERYANASNEVASYDLVILDGFSCYVTDIQEKLRVLNNIKDVDIVVVDNLQLVKSKKANRYEIMTEVSRDIKLTASQFNIPFICISHLSRAVEQNKNKKPTTADFKESGGIEQDLSIAFLLSHANEENKSFNIKDINIEVALNRNGPTFQTQLTWNGKTGAFEDKEN